MEQNEEYIVEFLPTAINDISEIISSFLMLGSKNGAKRIKDKFSKAADQVWIFPYSGASVPDIKLSKSGFRMMIIEKYLMMYKIFENEKKVIFYRVLNGKRNYPALMRYLYSETEGS